MGAIDAIAADPLQAARESQVVLLAVPIYATLDLMEKLAGVLGSEHLVTDVGSTKGRITEAAGRLFNTPERAAFLPGHPMAGKERGGAALGDAELFRDRGLALHRRSGMVRSKRALELITGVAGVGGGDGLEAASILIPRGTTRWWPGSAICRSFWRRR